MSAADRFIDDGYRPASRMPVPEDETSYVLERAARAGDGSNLGRWGSEGWYLPGQEAEGPGCGEYRPEGVCESGHVEWGIRMCGRRSCPTCWASQWAAPAAVRATVRIQAYRYTQPDDYRRQTAHAVVAPPAGEVMNTRQYYDGRSRAAEIAEEKGFRGAAVVPHPGRVAEDWKHVYRQQVPRGDDGSPVYGIWVWLRNDVGGDLDEWLEREIVEWAPHYHVIGPTSKDMEPGDESDAWVYEFIRSFSRFDGPRDRESHEDVYGAFRYLLSHTGWPEGSTRQAVVWYGDLANSVFVDDAREEWQLQKPSPGVMAVLERVVEDVADTPIDEDEGDGCAHEDEENSVCGHEGCDEDVIDVWDLDHYLQLVKPPPEVTAVMVACSDWRRGRSRPPPGLCKPQTEEEAEEALRSMV